MKAQTVNSDASREEICMNHRIRNEHQRAVAVKDLCDASLPCRVEIHEGEDLSAAQRRTAYLWYSEIARALGDCTQADIRRECKLTRGIPLLNETSEEHAYVYNNAVKHTLTYEQKLMLMDCWDVLGSRYMTQAVASRYLDGIRELARERGVERALTDPGEPAAVRAVA